MSQQPPPPYGYPQQPYYGPPPDHPQATTVLVLGILGLVVCQVISPVAWVMGNRVLREIDASGGQLGGRSNVNAGRICGIIGTILIGISLLVLVGFLGIFVVAGVAGSVG
ncbi:hypothetical protein [Nocardioides mangrovi]|uniref:DUF4190 domain-containing protein n=1 Tax=Nocardioides mangrovi TaxID=2874580 RepID=A0ABS7UF13_9ACTN|nr:hypothetical protein [Nocardioides mangrovi]MBZ5739601.1 hypothetical protein [Nocardioides mangrovi]